MPQPLSVGNRAELIEKVSNLVAAHSLQATIHAIVEVCYARALRQQYDVMSDGTNGTRGEFWRYLAQKFTYLEEIAEKGRI